MSLNGLGPAYCEFCVAIRTHDTSLLFDELFETFLTMKLSFNGRSDINCLNLLLLIMFLVYLSFMAVTNIQCHPLVEHLLLGATLLVPIHVTFPLGLTLFVNIVNAMVTLLRLARNYMVILLIILIVKQI